MALPHEPKFSFTAALHFLLARYPFYSIFRLFCFLLLLFFLVKVSLKIHRYSDTLLGRNPPTPVTLNSTQDYLDYGGINKQKKRRRKKREVQGKYRTSYNAIDQDSDISFLSNTNSANASTISLEGKSYFLPPSTVIIFDANKNILFNTSAVSNITVPHKVVFLFIPF